MTKFILYILQVIRRLKAFINAINLKNHIIGGFEFDWDKYFSYFNKSDVRGFKNFISNEDILVMFYKIKNSAIHS